MVAAEEALVAGGSGVPVAPRTPEPWLSHLLVCPMCSQYVCSWLGNVNKFLPLCKPFLTCVLGILISIYGNQGGKQAVTVYEMHKV